MAVRLSTLAEIKVLSLATLLYSNTSSPSAISGASVTQNLNELRNFVSSPEILQAFKNANATGGENLFKTIGIARDVRISEDFGTQNFYGIGAPTRPRIVPNNFSANASIARLQLDTRDLNHYITRPEYWYSDNVQRQIGIDDVLLYTFLFVKSKERESGGRKDIYALMPRTSERAYTSGDVMVVHNVSMVGFKYSYEEAFFDTENLINETITSDVRNQPAATGDTP